METSSTFFETESSRRTEALQICAYFLYSENTILKQKQNKKPDDTSINNDRNEMWSAEVSVRGAVLDKGHYLTGSIISL